MLPLVDEELLLRVQVIAEQERMLQRHLAERLALGRKELEGIGAKEEMFGGETS